MKRDSENNVKGPEPTREQRGDGAMQLILSMADTTWRMFTPPAIVVPIGIWADLKFGTKPWLTLLCAPVGLALSALLIRQQLRRGA